MQSVRLELMEFFSSLFGGLELRWKIRLFRNLQELKYFVVDQVKILKHQETKLGITDFLTEK